MRIGSILFRPRETFQEVENEGVGEALKQVVVLALIPATIMALASIIIVNLAVMYIGSTAGIGSMMGNVAGNTFIAAAIMFVMVYLATIFVLIVYALIFHIIVYIFGGKQGIEQTIKTVLYAATPTLLFGWIPLINFATTIWSIILIYIGLKELQKMSSGRALIAILIPVIIGIVILACVWTWTPSIESVSIPLTNTSTPPSAF